MNTVFGLFLYIAIGFSLAWFSDYNLVAGGILNTCLLLSACLWGMYVQKKYNTL